MKREIHRVDPWSAVRVGFFFGLVTGFLFGLLNSAIIKYLAGTLGSQMLPQDMMSMVNLSGGAIFAFSIVLALIMSLMFAVSGAIAALIYNLIANLFGGIEITTHDDDHADERPSVSMNHDHDEPPNE